MNTENKHMGNLLSNMSDKDLKEVFEQYQEKKFKSNDAMIKHIEDVLKCDKFDSYGNCDNFDCENMD